MDEFDKIRELSEGIVSRKEPTFTNEREEQDPLIPSQPDSDDAGLYRFKEEKAPIPTFSFDEPEEKKGTAKLHMIALCGFVSILAIAAAGYFSFASNETKDEDMPIIMATQEPVKVRPEQPGGMVIPDQDKLVYNRLRANEIPTKVEKLFPEPEKPVLPEILIEQNAPEAPFVPIDNTTSLNPLDETERLSQPIIIEEIPPVPKKEVIQLPQKAQQKQPAKAPQKPAKTSKASQNNEIWRVQLLSSSNKASVEKAWPNILKKNKALLSDMSYDIVSAQIPGKGTFYRLQVGHFTTRDMAAGLCSKLKNQGQECVPVKN